MSGGYAVASTRSTRRIPRITGANQIKRARLIQTTTMKLSIKELDDLFKQNKNISVLSKNIDNQEISYKEVLNSNITGVDVELLEITDEESGFTIKCTEDHLIFTKNRGYVKAKDLNELDILDVI